MSESQGVKPFSNGSEYMIWLERNCFKCLKNVEVDDDGDYETFCDIEEALSLGSVTDGKIDKQIYRRMGDPHEFNCPEKLEKKIKVIEYNTTCSACPSQWEGLTDDKKQVYIRYRWGFLYINVDDKTIFGTHFGDEYGGYMTTEKMKELLSRFVDWSY